jgi:hypothetical protein
MDADENEKDPYYLPERHIPVLKLFKKVVDKSSVVSHATNPKFVTGRQELAGYVQRPAPRGRVSAVPEKGDEARLFRVHRLAVCRVQGKPQCRPALPRHVDVVAALRMIHIFKKKFLLIFSLHCLFSARKTRFVFCLRISPIPRIFAAWIMLSTRVASTANILSLFLLASSTLLLTQNG